MRVLVGIDGTGPFFDSEYEPAFKRSFVKRLCPESDPRTHYCRGPDTAGGGTEGAIRSCLRFIDETGAGKKGGPKLLITGYSRGAFAVLVLAELLRQMKITVDAALLFDAVDRYAYADADEVPTNVRYAMHFMRNPKSGSRGSFGNCGTKPVDEKATWYRPRLCLCTHGGVGGTPWPMARTGWKGRVYERGNHPQDLINEEFPDGWTKVTYGQDARVSEEVWVQAQPFIKRHGFTNLGAAIPTPDPTVEDDYSDIGTADAFHNVYSRNGRV